MSISKIPTSRHALQWLRLWVVCGSLLACVAADDCQCCDNGASPLPAPSSAALVSSTSQRTLSRRSSDALNSRPVIGVLAEDYYGPVSGVSSYIAASYVKWIEAAGARVVPVALNQTDDYYDRVLSIVNGLLFPGGSVFIDLNTGYGLTGRRLYKKVLELNKANYFPLWGTCLGLELALYAHLNGHDPRIRCHSQDDALPLEFTDNLGRLFGEAPPSILRIMSTENVTINYHSYCVTPEDMKKSGLAKDFDTLAVNADANGLRFVSAVEHKTMPIYLVQFHPEKVRFEWVNNTKHAHIPHTSSASAASQYLADFFVNECRLNKNRFPETESKMLIYAHPATYTQDYSIYTQSYLFP